MGSIKVPKLPKKILTLHIAMIARRITPNLSLLRFISTETTKSRAKRFMQTIPVLSKSLQNIYNEPVNYYDSKDAGSSRWSKHTLGFPVNRSDRSQSQSQLQSTAPVRRSRTSRFKKPQTTISFESEPAFTTFKTKTLEREGKPKESIDTKAEAATPKIADTTPKVEESTPKVVETTPKVESTTPKAAPKKKRTLRPRKALITLTGGAMEHLRALMNQPEPKLIRIGVRNRGCSGLTYDLDYVDKPGKFDELIEQDDVKVLIDSKALFSIVGSEMDWVDDKLSSRFIFRNPNSKGTCGCGESFMV